MRGIDIVRCPVGDKYVMEEMIRRGLVARRRAVRARHLLGISVHRRWPGHLAQRPAHDGAPPGGALADLASELTTYPQVLINVRVERKVDLSTVPEVAAVMAAVESRLAGHGRLLIRYSGTEPLLRVMLEGQDQRRSRAGRTRSRRRQTAPGVTCKS